MNPQEHRLAVRDHFLTRREFLSRCGMGMGSLGLVAALGQSGFLPQAHGSATAAGPLSPKSPHFPARAKAVIHIFPAGGASHVDTWDPKPALEKYVGKALSEVSKEVQYPGAAFPSPFKFKK